MRGIWNEFGSTHTFESSPPISGEGCGTAILHGLALLFLTAAARDGNTRSISHGELPTSSKCTKLVGDESPNWRNFLSKPGRNEERAPPCVCFPVRVNLGLRTLVPRCVPEIPRFAKPQMFAWRLQANRKHRHHALQHMRCFLFGHLPRTACKPSYSAGMYNSLSRH